MRLFKIILTCCFLALTCKFAFAGDDGFGSAKKVQGEHFIVYYAPQLDPYALLNKLNIRPSEALLTAESGAGTDNLAYSLDTLYNIVMQALDMPLYSLQGTIKICRDRAHLDSVYENIFNRELRSGSFYINDYKTIYISADDFTKEVLGHEIAHMIISNYFVVQPPEKVAEILAGYIEYQLRKTSR